MTSCEAAPVTMNEGDPENAPWNPVYTELTITCSAEGEESAFCTGRRPLGHREAKLQVNGIGPWFALHAHLEAAAVDAFAQLADWLDKHNAPPQLVARCHAAGRDELEHARLMSEQAHHHGATPPALEADTCPTGRLELAIHNATEGCVSEAFAALIAAHQARSAESEASRELFATLAEDELRHGQLAWDIDAWLCAGLSPSEVLLVERARARAYRQLPQLAREAARMTPSTLGWPSPAHAEAMAREFATQLEHIRRAA